MRCHSKNIARIKRFNESLGVVLAGSRINQRVAGNRSKRWRCSLRPDMAVLRNTRSEAIAWFKRELRWDKVPDGVVIESF